MIQIIVNPNMPLAVSIKKFTKLVNDSGVLKEARKHEVYTKPSVKKRLKSLLARTNLKKLSKKRKYD